MAELFEKFPRDWLSRAVGELVACEYITSMSYVGPTAEITLRGGHIGVIEEPEGGVFSWTILDPTTQENIWSGSVQCTEDAAIDGRNIWHAMARAVPAVA